MGASSSFNILAQRDGDGGWTIVKVDSRLRVVTLKEMIMVKLHLDVSPTKVALSLANNVLDDVCFVRDVLKDGDCVIVRIFYSPGEIG
jgi:hypothetical protein